MLQSLHRQHQQSFSTAIPTALLRRNTRSYGHCCVEVPPICSAHPQSCNTVRLAGNSTPATANAQPPSHTNGALRISSSGNASPPPLQNLHLDVIAHCNSTADSLVAAHKEMLRKTQSGNAHLLCHSAAAVHVFLSSLNSSHCTVGDTQTLSASSF
jgi:hypothetical protein